MNEHEKFLTCVGVLPTLADYLEDVLDAKLLNMNAKHTANILIAQIRRFDNICMKGADIEVIDQQNNIGLAFRDWDNKNYK